MTIDDVSELYYIVPRLNLLSLLERGIMSHRNATKLADESLADPEVQLRRARRRVTAERFLHEYANLYFCARNPMMRKLVSNRAPETMAVLAIDPDVMRQPGTMVSDGNAAAGETKFMPFPDGLTHLDFAVIHGEWYGDPVLKRRKCAEVLVLHWVPRFYFRRILVSTQEAAEDMAGQLSRWPIIVAPGIFFQ